MTTTMHRAHLRLMISPPSTPRRPGLVLRVAAVLVLLCLFTLGSMGFAQLALGMLAK